jgi:uncharacterized LabA/DUF88 family protein
MKELDKKLNNYAFIDGNNLYLGVKSQGWKLDYKRFRVLLKDKYKVNKAFLCIGYYPGNEKLYISLQEQGYICVFKPLLEIRDEKKIRVKGNVDAELVLHTMIEYPNYNKAIVVSGDGDFHCLIEYLVQQNKLLKLIAPNMRYSSLLKEFSQFIVNINIFRSKLELRNRK